MERNLGGGPADLGSYPRCATELHGTSGKPFLACLRPASGQKVNTLSYSGALGDKTGSGSQGPQEPSGAWALPQLYLFWGTRQTTG